MKKILFIASFFLLIFSASSVQAASGCCKIIKETAVYEITAFQEVYMTMQSEDCDKQKGPNTEVTFEEGKVASTDSKSCEDATGTTGESQPSKPITPQLQVSLPGFEKFSDVTCDNPEVICEIPWIAEYIKAFYNYGLAIIGILSVIVMMIGGIIRISAGGNNAQISHGNQYIKGSILGIIFAFCSYSILFLLNPNLTILKPINVSYIAYIELDQTLPPEELTPEFTNVPQGIVGYGEGKYKLPIIYQGSYKGTIVDNTNVGPKGCGPTSMTMVLNFFGISITVPQTAQIAADNGNWGNGHGWTGGMPGFQKIATKYGLKSKSIGPGSSFEDAIKLLEFGPVVVSVTHNGKCIFTKDAHYVIITGYDNGILTINDPNGFNAGKTGRVSLSTVKNGCVINAGAIAIFR